MPQCRGPCERFWTLFCAAMSRNGDYLGTALRVEVELSFW